MGAEESEEHPLQGPVLAEEASELILRAFTPIAGASNVVEVDETYVGGKAKIRIFKARPRSIPLFVVNFGQRPASSASV